MWAAAARDVSSRSPPPVSDRHLSITDSIVSTTAEEIRERYRLSSFQDEPIRPPVRPIAHLRRDSMFSFNTTWTADESFMDSSGMISDFPRPPAMPGFAAPAIPSSIGHAPPSAWQSAPDSARRTEGTGSNTATPYADSFPYANSPGLPQSSAYSSSTHLHAPSPTAPPPTPRNLSRPGTAPSALTVRTDARYLDPNTGAEIEVVNGPSPSNSPVPSLGARDSMATTVAGRASVAGSGGRASVAGSGGRASLAPSGTRHSPSSPSSQYLVPSPSSLAYTRTSPTHTQDHTYTTNRTSPTHTEADKIPGFPVAPSSPNTAAFLRSPVAPPSTHTSHEELLDPGFIRGMMRGIEYGDGLSISSEAEGPFGDRFAAPEPLFRRPPAASLPSSPRSSFSFSVRSGVGKAGWEDVPDVPPLPAAYRPGALASPPSHLPPSPPSHVPEPSTPPHEPPSPHSQTHSIQSQSQAHSTQSLRPDWSSRRRSVESRKTTVTGRSGGSGLTGITELSGTEETGIVQHAALVRTASLAERRPAVYKSTEALRSPPLEEWVSTPGGHARTTSADLAPGQEVRNRRSVQQLQFLSVTHPRVRGLGSEEVREDVQEGDELVYVGGEDLDAYRRSGYELEYGRDSQYARDSRYENRESQYGNRESQYGNRESRYGNRESQYDNRQSRYDHRGSKYPDSYLDSPYVGSWADPPSPNEITPALRDSMINDTASYMRPGRTPIDPTHGMHSPLSTTSRFVPPFARDGYGSPSTAPATPGHGSSPLTPGYNSTPLSPGPQTAPLPDNVAPRHAKRASGTSFVSSVFSKFSGHASAGHNAKGFSFAWRNDAPPLPTPSPHALAATPSLLVASALTPPSPHAARMWEAKSSAAHSGTGSDSTRVSAIARREGTMELPALANRAERLNEMLELGRLPHRSKSTLGISGSRVVDVPVGVDQEGNDVYPSVGDGFTDEKALRRNRSLRSVFTTISDRSRRFIGAGGGQGSLRSSIVDVQGQDGLRFNKLPEEHRKIQWGEGTGVPPPRPARSARLPKKRLWTLVAIAVIAILAIIGVSVGIRQAGKRQPDAGGYTCSAANQTGRLCDLDATCTCTSSLAGQCNPLAQSIVDLIEPINRVFNPSPAFTPASVALSIWEIQGSPLAGANCANQVDLIDVGPALSFTERNSVAANRTEFARSALLWTLVMTMDTNGTAEMQDFVQGLDFTRLDGPSGSSLAGEFLFGGAGYQFDFGKLTVTQPAVTWQLAGKPSDAQVALVNTDMRQALDRVYTFASASSDQRSTALQRYWSNVLQFPAAQLDEFRSIASGSPVLLPFDATSSQIRPLFSNVNQSFPPPAACYPGLDAAELNAINAMETEVFGLSRVTSAPRSLDASCFSSRPVYGVLDIARLRTAFPSAESNAPKQTVQVAATSVSRASVRLGRGAVGIPSTSISTTNLTGSDDPRTYGTLNNMDHVLLTYLQAFPTIQAAGALVDYVLGASDARAAPPSNTSALFNLTSSLAQLPVLEVAYFGTIGPSDLSMAVSDFATDDGQLFFGSSAADSFRNWATQRAGQVAWADGPIAAQVVREGKTKDQTFEQVWDGGSAFLSNAELTGTKTSRTEVQTIVDAFTRIGYMGV